MQKTRLGVSVGVLGAIVYFTGIFSGYLLPVLITGYILLFEENEWLKKNSFKAVGLMIFFSFFTVLFNLIPDCMGIISDIFSAFGGYFSAYFLNGIIAAITDIIDVIEKILFLILGIKAINQSSVSVPFIDQVIEKYSA